MITVLILLLSLLVTAYMYMTRNFNHWKNKGVFYLKPVPFVGNIWSLFTFKYSIGDFVNRIYKDYEDEPYVGIFIVDMPCLIVRDYELVQRIFMQDYQYFNSRIFTLSKKTDPIAARSLFSIHGKEWKNTRARLTPIFTTKKQKTVFEAMAGVGNKLEEKLNQASTIELNELAVCFTIDIISDAVFGLNGQAIKDSHGDHLRKLASDIFDASLWQCLRINLSFLAPELLNLLNISLIPDSLYNVMRETTFKALSLRSNSQKRNGDYIDALLELREKGPWEGDNGEIIVPDDDNLVAQVFMFFTAGFETAASGVTHCLYELAKNQDIQEKIRAEMTDVIEKHDGIFSYEVLNDLTYLNKFIQESLRKNPPFPFIDRECLADYTIPGTNIVIEKGTKVMIPMLALQRDKKFYEDPDSIIPERFDDANSAKEKPYFPFGMGPRTCLGMRFALQLIKVCMVSSLRNHRISTTKNTPTTLKMCARRFGNTPDENIELKITKLNES